MFDIGFIELLICGVIALLVLGPERLPTAARAAGRWIGGARRMVSQFTSELDRQLKAEELREELRKAGDVGLEDMEKTVRGALDEAKKYEHMILPDSETRKPNPAPATRRVAEATDVRQTTPPEPAGDQSDIAKTDSNSQAASPSPESTPDNRS
ncbi:Sec-independent protein translocase protein TatB [Marinobacter halophilus]|uniref:Sec-independent protein translocase protein TatB n=1 Tax=Marinobacter halophilus TaxID=1323740 RepID=A0A2T1KF49_9GAMM|nr:Sec-independent protein translocase protein TatB [Marinobacter halophilus]PSF08668.1 twin-arginine translocase subunit TatB [Marinobacter halophilus]GGC62691.1 sec-independent protein translocase protein TatB [Marinobacter halophilus]